MAYFQALFLITLCFVLTRADFHTWGEAWKTGDESLGQYQGEDYDMLFAAQRAGLLGTYTANVRLFSNANSYLIINDDLDTYHPFGSISLNDFGGISRNSPVLDSVLSIQWWGIHCFAALHTNGSVSGAIGRMVVT